LGDIELKKCFVAVFQFNPCPNSYAQTVNGNPSLAARIYVLLKRVGRRRNMLTNSTS
jgi:hypothetical protein